jgi:hypothetical protein
MIERLRALLATRVPTGFRVTEKRTQYFMSEDSAAFCEIAVQGGGHEFALVVVRSRGNAGLDDLFVRVWLEYAMEIWLVDEDAHRVRRATPEHREPVELTDQLVPVAIAGVRVNVGELRECQ